MSTLHRYGVAFVGVNAAAIVLYALGALIAPEPFWKLQGVVASGAPFERLTAWYLLAVGLAGLFAVPKPQAHPIVVGLLGFEKIGAVVFFVHQITTHTGGGINLPILVVALWDATMAVLLLAYAGYLRRLTASSAQA